MDFAKHMPDWDIVFKSFISLCIDFKIIIMLDSYKYV